MMGSCVLPPPTAGWVLTQMMAKQRRQFQQELHKLVLLFLLGLVDLHALAGSLAPTVVFQQKCKV